MSETKQRTVHVIGAGGVGFWLTLALNRSDVRPIVVYDDDDLTGGLGHARLPVASPTTRKVDLLRGILRTNFGGYEGITFVPTKFTGAEAVAGDLVVDCSDMALEPRQAIYNAVIGVGARYLRVSYDGRLSIIVVAEGLPFGGAEGGYAAVPSLGLSLAAGGLGAELISNLPETHVEFQITLADYYNPQAVAAWGT